VTIVGSTVSNNNVGLDLAADGSSAMFFDVANATVTGQLSNAIQIISGATSTAGCTVNGTIADSDIGSPGVPASGSQDGQGIAIDIRGGADAAIALTDNVVSHTDKEGISAQARLGSATLDLTLTGNTVNAPDDDEVPGVPVDPFGILVQARDASALCLNVGTNTSAGAGAGTGYRVRQRDTSSFALERFVGNGTVTGDVDGFVTSENTSGTATLTTLTTGFTGVADGACETP